MTLSIVSPAFRHLRTDRDGEVKDMLILVCVHMLYKCMCMWVNSPADIIYGDVPQLFVHGRLALLAGIGTEG